MSGKDTSDLEKKNIINSIRDAGEAAQATEKLLKTHIEVEMAEDQDEMDLLELDEARLTERLRSTDGKTDDASVGKRKDIEAELVRIRDRRTELAGKTVKALLVPLKYRDYRIVQTAVAEALITTDGMGFDIDTKIAMVLQERKLMTVFLALRCRGNPDERFFKSLDEYVKISDRTVDELYKSYVDSFELTRSERKN